MSGLPPRVDTGRLNSSLAHACALGSICGFLQGAWSFGVVDGCSCLAQKTAEAAAAIVDRLADAGARQACCPGHPHLREMALRADRDPVHFWSKFAALPSAAPPKRIQRLLRKCLPGTVENIAFSHRIAGAGSLGRPRYVATGSSNGGFVAREAKAWLPSAWGWAKGRPKAHAYSVRLLKQSVREPDPYYFVQDGWVVRRLGPHCGRIELTEFPKKRDERLILKDMGRETANLHLATPMKESTCCTI